MNIGFILLIAMMWLVGPLVYSASTIRNMILGWRIPITWISALPNQGWVEVIGKARGDTIKSLLQKTDCVYWQFEVKEYQSSGRGGGRWKTAFRTSSGDFEMDDMTGGVKIIDGKMDLVMDDEFATEKPDQDTKILLEKLGVKTKGVLGLNKRLRVYERTVSAEKEVLVLGRIQRNEDATSISGASIAPLVITNLSKPVLLKTLFWQIFRPMILTYLAGFALIAFYLYMTFR
jgi:hypothetical protein